MDTNQQSESLHRKLQGKIGTEVKVKVQNKEDLSLVYTPGVAHVSSLIAKDPALVYELTGKANTIAIISDGSAVLGLGDIGPFAALPVMEGKALILKEFTGVNGVPLVIDTKDTEQIIQFVKNVSPTFGAIILEDFSAPRCFEIESRLREELSIPVIHDDQHVLAMVVLAGLINALTLRDGEVKKDVRIVIVGAGAAGIAATKLLSSYGFLSIVLVDSRGIISKDRTDISGVKQEMLKITNKEHISGDLAQALVGADVCIGVSVGDTISPDMVSSMNEKPIIFALANPTPEINPTHALRAGAYVVATGRSDYPNQLNNALIYPGLIKGALMHRIKQFDESVFIRVAEALAGHVIPTKEAILPDVFDKGVVDVIARVVGEK